MGSVAEELLFTEDMLSFCQQMPKVELHAHLNGCIRDETIRDLAHQKLKDQQVEEHIYNLTKKDDRSLSECFQLFDAIHRITTDHNSITRITEEVLSDFQSDNTVYLEIRTTPKNRPECGISKRSYVEAVLLGLAKFQAHSIVQPGQVRMVVQLVLSIDRRESTQEALDTVQLAIEYKDRGVVGVDLSGNPSVGKWDTWEPALVAAREAGLKLTLHCAEVWNCDEALSMILFPADRLGHCCCLDQNTQQQLAKSGIPVELCLSSNVRTESVASFADHHFIELYKSGHPVCLCTDDTGIFSTTLSREMAIGACHANMSKRQIFDVAARAVDYAFIKDEEKAVLKEVFQEFARQHSL